MNRIVSEGVILEDVGLPAGFFNAAAIDLGNGSTGLEGRFVLEGAADGKPDEGATQLLVIGNDGAALAPAQILWRPHGGDTLEDVRIHDTGTWLTRHDDATPHPLDEVVIKGFTRVAMVDGEYLPFPAVARATKRELLEGDFPSTDLLQYPTDLLPSVSLDGRKIIPGKNVTPLHQQEDGNWEIAYRPSAWNHAFLVGEVDADTSIASRVQGFGIAEPDRPEWMSYRAGLCNSPFWISSMEALLILHGIRMVPGAEPDTSKYEYALGTARLTRSPAGRYGIDNISPEPLVVPHDWPDRVELHPELRNVVYMVGAVVSDGAIEAYPQFGDTKTVKMTITRPRVQDTIRNWDRTPLFAA
jgi:hypothetical protein